jgi:hypothetical protein
MSAPEYPDNLWLSLHDLLSNNKYDISVGALASSIEKEGIQTWDRFGRRISANGESPESLRVKEEALDLLAEHYEIISRDVINNFTLDYEKYFPMHPHHPMMYFGWPEDEAPDFSGYESESLPQALMASHSMEKVPRIDAKRTYLLILAVLFKEAKIDFDSRGTTGLIARATEELGSPVSEETVRNILKDIPEAIEYRRK